MIPLTHSGGQGKQGNGVVQHDQKEDDQQPIPFRNGCSQVP